jgi:hypothetical protein
MRPPCATSSSSPQQNWSTEQESNLRPSVYQTDAQAAVLLVGGAPCKNRTCFFATGEAHRRQCLRGQKLGASGANRTPIGRLPCDCFATELHRLEPKGGFNRHLSFTRAPFFPLNYFDLLNEDLERVTGLEPVSGPWRGPILAARRYPLGASGENRTLLASLEIWNSTNKSRSLELQRLTFICQRTHFDGNTWTV